VEAILPVKQRWSATSQAAATDLECPFTLNDGISKSVEAMPTDDKWSATSNKYVGQLDK
jgi:hypothetical protein